MKDPWARAIEALGRHDREEWDRHVAETHCPVIGGDARLYLGLSRNNWTPEELAHLAQCGKCQLRRDKIAKVIERLDREDGQT